ncbi:MAG: 2-amino-4-hydroxy-6-hydroxymethyldihydropteridine diphosphokinase, partial [Synergistales bacterium]|nr:2-amino-4-hydroxy-6-hydroxymethyldihydropteridine diphosphokinase [Synergistales bacterium]
MVSTAAIALGSNLGDRLSALRKAVSLLQCAGIIVKASSDVFETLPWGETDQPLFLNACILAETSMPPEDLLHLLKKLETDLGREGGKRWGPRVIDLDIVFYDCTILHTKDLVLPHRD